MNRAARQFPLGLRILCRELGVEQRALLGFQETMHRTRRLPPPGEAASVVQPAAELRAGEVQVREGQSDGMAMAGRRGHHRCAGQTCDQAGRLPAQEAEQRPGAIGDRRGTGPRTQPASTPPAFS